MPDCTPDYLLDAYTPRCPTWCSQQHLLHTPPEDGSVHHDSTTRSVRCMSHGGELTRQLHVAAHREDRPNGHGGPALVSLIGDSHVIAELSPDEAIDLARHLLNAAAVTDET